MPSRKLPNSHIHRRKILRRAWNKGKNLDQSARPFPAAVWAKLDLAAPTSLASRYLAALTGVDTAERALSDATAAVDATFPKLVRTVSHFFQVLDFAIERDVWPASIRDYHGRDAGQARLPALGTYDEAIDQAETILTGEDKRAQDDGASHTPMSLPGIAEVTTVRDAFLAARATQSPLKDALVNAQTAVEALMEGEAGILRLILDLYDETEHTYRHLEDGAKRTLCREWGIYYEGDAELPEEEDPAPPAPTP